MQKMVNNLLNDFDDFIFSNVANVDEYLNSLYNRKDQSCDVIKDDDKTTIVMDIPGVEKKDVKITLENRVLTITAKNEKRNYKKVFSCLAEKKDIKSSLELGVLTLTLNRPKVKKESFEIEID